VVALGTLSIAAGCAAEPTTGAQPGGYNPIGYQGYDIPPCIDHDAKDTAKTAADVPTTDKVDAGSTAQDVASKDSGASVDAGSLTDAGGAKDAGTATVDAGGSTDTGGQADATSTPDAGTGPKDIAVDAGPPPLNFSYVYDEVFKKFGCTASLCHGAKAKEMAFLADKAKAYGLLVNKASQVKDCKFLPIVLPGKPENSVLYTKIKPWMKACGEKMPVGTDGVTDAAAKIVYDWIKKGAPK